MGHPHVWLRWINHGNRILDKLIYYPLYGLKKTMDPRPSPETTPIRVHIERFTQKWNIIKHDVIEQIWNPKLHLSTTNYLLIYPQKLFKGLMVNVKDNFGLLVILTFLLFVSVLIELLWFTPDEPSNRKFGKRQIDPKTIDTIKQDLAH